MLAVALALVLIAVAASVAYIVQRRRPRAAATAPPAYGAPSAVDRNDLPYPDAARLVVVFTSSTCSTCAETVDRLRAGAGRPVVDVAYESQRDLHARYGIDAVPTTLLVDQDGRVLTTWHGPVDDAGLAALAD